MSDITQTLAKIESGDPAAAEQLLPLVYDELRKLAAAKLARERPGQTLQATALVHEAYLRLVHVDDSQQWDGRGHFFAAAAEAMRRILVEAARRKASLKRGGDIDRITLPEIAQFPENAQFNLLALDEALASLERLHPENARIVKLRFFGGLSLEETAEVCGILRRLPTQMGLRPSLAIRTVAGSMNEVTHGGGNLADP